MPADARIGRVSPRWGPKGPSADCNMQGRAHRFGVVANRGVLRRDLHRRSDGLSYLTCPCRQAVRQRLLCSSAARTWSQSLGSFPGPTAPRPMMTGLSVLHMIAGRADVTSEFGTNLITTCMEPHRCSRSAFGRLSIRSPAAITRHEFRPTERNKACSAQHQGR